jgi:hypothetical protein
MRMNASSMASTIWEVRSTVETNKDCFRRVAPSFRGSDNHFQIKFCGILVLWKSYPVYCHSQIEYEENTWQGDCHTSFWRNGETNVATHFHFFKFILSLEFDVLRILSESSMLLNNADRAQQVGAWVRQDMHWQCKQHTILLIPCHAVFCSWWYSVVSLRFACDVLLTGKSTKAGCSHQETTRWASFPKRGMLQAFSC